ncbi:MAG: hypothetical protein VKK98_09395 [Cyanobacteriota bacterium]|nr:hypothetical protein [Cyanobacteriota bacterium]
MLANQAFRTICCLTMGSAGLIWLGYSALKVPPYHWYYGFPLFTLVALASTASLAANTRRRAAAAICIHIMALAGGASISLHRLNEDQVVPIQTNWATVSQYQMIASSMNQIAPNGAYELEGELGVIQFFSTAHAIDGFSNRQPAMRWATSSPETNPIQELLTQINFMHLKHATPPSDSRYLLTSNRQQCANPAEKPLQTWIVSNP